MGQTSGKLYDATTQKTWMGIQRAYTEVTMAKVDFSQPTGNESDEDDDEKEEEAGGQRRTVEEDVRFESYKPSKLKVEGMRPHPSDAVENGTLATVAPPDVTYKLNIAEDMPHVISEGRLSDLQLEFVTYACQRHEQRLASGSRRGFFLGDGAGMGKGRQLAGLILENVLAGRRKHIWCTTNIDLKEDATRDLRDVGCTIAKDLEAAAESGSKRRRAAADDDAAVIDVFALPTSSTAKIDPEREGVLVLTYSGLSASGGAGSRLQQVVDWCGEDYDGCLLFDESHCAKNLIADLPGTETAAARAVDTIQRLLPNARVVYCSATAASEPRHYAYMTRLGLWGPASPFPSADAEEGESNKMAIQNFIKTCESRGVGAMELCALHLKREGALLCRTLSYAGAEFSVVEASLTPEQIETYDASAQLWQMLYTRMERKLAKMELWVNEAMDPREMENRKDEFKEARQNYHSQLWSGHLRFFRSLITAMKVPKLVELAKTALAEDKCVVIGLQSTGEAHAKRIREKLEAAAADGEDIQEDMLSAPQETLRYVVRKVWGNELAEVERLKAVAERAAARAEALAKEEADAAAERAARAHVDDGLSDSDEDMEDTAALLKKPLGNKNSSPSKRRSSDAKLDVYVVCVFKVPSTSLTRGRRSLVGFHTGGVSMTRRRTRRTSRRPARRMARRAQPARPASAS